MKTEDELEDDASPSIDEDELDKEQEWIEEDPTASASAALEASRRKSKRFRLTHEQTRFLLNEFSREQHPDIPRRERLAKEIPGLSPRQVQVWFQNRRAKLKRLAVEDQERMIAFRAMGLDYPSGVPLYSASDNLIRDRSLSSSAAASPSAYHHTVPLPRPEVVGLRPGIDAASSNMPFAGSAGNVLNPHNLHVALFPPPSGQASSSQPPYQISPISSSRYGVPWESSYTSSEGHQPSLSSYTNPPDAGSPTIFSRPAYSGITSLTDPVPPLTSLQYGSIAPYAGLEGDSAYANRALSTTHQLESAPTTSPPVAAQHGVASSYTDASLLLPNPSSVLNRHDSVSDSSQTPSSEHTNYPLDVTLSHMPRYHRYNE